MIKLLNMQPSIMHIQKTWRTCVGHLNSNALHDTKDHNTGCPSLTTNNDQITHNMSGPATKSQSSCARTDKQISLPKCNSNCTHTYSLCPQKAVAPNK